MHYARMQGTRNAGTPNRVRPREISEADIPELVNMLTRGYEYLHPREFWQSVFAGLSRRSVPAGFPRYGHVIESDGKLVGVLIQIFSNIWKGETASVRCCGSALYVEPAFRVYGSLLASRRPNKTVTLLNTTASPHTHKMLESSGFAKYSNGMFVAIPLFSPKPKDSPVRIISAQDEPDAPFNPHDRELLLEHADFGCISLWCVTEERAYPFVFRSRVVKFLPCAQLVYSGSVEDFVRFARPIGFYLARKLRLIVLLDADGPVPGLFGKYRAKIPRFFLGPDRPQTGDLAYTETALFGI
jgi:hypothetical protein